MQFDKEKTKKALTNWYKDKGIDPYDPNHAQSVMENLEAALAFLVSEGYMKAHHIEPAMRAAHIRFQLRGLF